MTAAIVQRNDLPALAAIEDDRLVEESPLEQLAIHDLMVPAAYVPAIFQEHCHSPVASGARLIRRNTGVMGIAVLQTSREI
jgi:hypothetical protein